MVSPGRGRPGPDGFPVDEAEPGSEARSCEHAPVRIQLTKYQALGNDYLVLDAPGAGSGEPLAEIQRLASRICDRHTGLGADGILLFDPAAMSVRIVNPDGSEAERSGNGLRIAAAHAVLDHGAPAAFGLTTPAGENRVTVIGVDGPEVVTSLEIGRPSFAAPDLPARLEGEPGPVSLATPAGTVRAVLVSVGNPHCVVFGEPVTRQRCLELGPHLERHPIFPRRTNVQLVEVIDPRTLRIEIWERGAGYTLASGTSSAAAAAACMREGLTGDEVEVRMPGGALHVRRTPEGNLVLTGPAARVYRAEVDLADLA